MANNKFMEYESVITEMEHEMIQIQRVWSKGQDQRFKTNTNDTTSPMLSKNKHASIQAIVETKPREMQTDPYTCCLDKKQTSDIEVQTTFSKESDPEDEKFKEKVKETAKEPTKETSKEMEVKEKKEEAIHSKEDTRYKETIKTTKEMIGEKVNVEHGEKAEKDAIERKESDQEMSLLREQLDQALKLSSERSSALIKYELQIAECQAKVDSLNEIIKSKDLALAQKEKIIEEYKLSPRVQHPTTDCSEKLALKSTINSLQKLVSQKEETIGRYQNLLKEDRDEHSKAAARLQEEIRSLQSRILSMQSDTQRVQQRQDDRRDEPEKLIEKVQEAESKIDDIRNIVMQTEEVARLKEKVSTLEADLSITKELSDRWHRLAEERLNHVDRTRERYRCR